MSAIFNHVGLSVADLDREVAFYTDAFGLHEEFRFEVEQEGIEAVVLRSDDGWGIEIMSRTDSVPRARYDSPNANLRTQGYGHFCLRVDDIHGLYERLLSLGATTIAAPGPAPHPAITFCHVADPEGHFVELIQIPEGLEL